MKIIFDKRCVANVIASALLVGSGIVLGCEIMRVHTAKKNNNTVKGLIGNIKNLTGVDLSRAVLYPVDETKKEVDDVLKPIFDNIAMQKYGTTDVKFNLACFAQKADD